MVLYPVNNIGLYQDYLNIKKIGLPDICHTDHCDESQCLFQDRFLLLYFAFVCLVCVVF